jgi:hypothetical protein
MQCLKSQHSFPYGLNNDVLGYATTGGDGTDPITPSAGGGVGFDATYDALVNTLTSEG